MLAFDVVREAGDGDDGSANDKPVIGKPIQREPAVQGKDKYNSTATDSWCFVGASRGRFVDDFVIPGHPEIRQHPGEEGDNKEEDVEKISEV